MPDEPRSEDAKDRDEDLDKELDEFEAELFKAVEESKGPIRPPLSGVRTPDPSEGTDDAIPELPTDEDIEARLSRVIKDAEQYMGPIKGSSLAPEMLEDFEQDPRAEEQSRFHDQHPDLAARLQELEKRAHIANHSRQSKSEKRAIGGRSEGESARGLGIGLTVAYTIIGGPLGGALLGYLLDKQFGTTMWTGICVVIGAVGGMVLGLLILNRNQPK